MPTIYEPGRFCQALRNGDTVWYEAGVFDAQHEALRLIYPVDEILEVRSADFPRVYVPGRDYVLENGRVVRTQQSEIPLAFADTLPIRQACNETETISDGLLGEANYYYLDDKRGLRLIRDSEYLDQAVLVSYRHSRCDREGYQNEPTEITGTGLPGYFRKLEQGQSVQYLIFGDSALTGASASGAGMHYRLFDRESRPMPFRTGFGGRIPPFFEMFADEAARRYGGEYRLWNLAVGGMTSQWGREALSERLDTAKLPEGGTPDLALIGFFANDFGSDRIDAPQYGEALSAIIRILREKYPDIGMILLTGYPCNERCVRYHRPAKKEAMQRISRELAEKTENCLCVNTGRFLDRVLCQKRHREFLANNINHGGDFLQMLWAQSLCEILPDREKNPEKGLDKPLDNE